MQINKNFVHQVGDQPRLQYLFVHMLVYNKHLLFNMHSMNIKAFVN